MSQNNTRNDAERWTKAEIIIFGVLLGVLLYFGIMFVAHATSTPTGSPNSPTHPAIIHPTTP